MATALHPTRNEPATNTNVHVNVYPRAVMTDLDFKDNRYPQINQSQQRTSQRVSSMYPTPDDLPSQFSSTSERPTIVFRQQDLTNQPFSSSHYPAGPAVNPQSVYQSYPQPQQSPQHPPTHFSQHSQQQHEPQRGAVSYSIPPGAARRVVERYSLDDNQQQRPSSRGSAADNRKVGFDSINDLSRSPTSARPRTPQDRSQVPTTPRTPSIPTSPGALNVPGYPSPIMPLSASISYTPPVSPNPRAYPQQPKYITPVAAPNPISPIYSPNPPPPPEEVCIECAMRDQDMADVDVTSPGVWERDSDVLFEELQRREMEEESQGIVPVDDSRPRTKGGRLTEQNLKLWLSINPREPASRQQTLNNYIKSQRALLEAEALAHARAMQEAKQLDSRMRDAYSQLRRSAYDVGSSAAPSDDLGGVRIRPPKSPVGAGPSKIHARANSREVTLLENGMIVEHVDVRKEEREARERRKREERRARKSSRGSGVEVTSIMSGQTGYTDGGLGLRPQTRYSQASLPRPNSVLTAPVGRGEIPSTYSQISFSDFHSLNNPSPRRSRFFGLRSFGSPWGSQASLAPSGSMVNMHLSSNRDSMMPQFGHDNRQSQLWPQNGQPSITENGQIPAPDAVPLAPDVVIAEEKAKKKKRGLAKFWQIVTGSKNEGSKKPSLAEKPMDDLPLAPPPPLSYLVDRGSGGSDLRTNGRGAHASTPTLPTSARNGFASPGMSPSTAASSVLPSPASARTPGSDLLPVEIKYTDSPSYGQEDAIRREDEYNEKMVQNTVNRNLHLMTSEPDMRNRMSQSMTIPAGPQSPIMQLSPSQQSQQNGTISREKSLPPLPNDPRPRTATLAVDNRPRTVYTYDSRQLQLPPGAGMPHDFNAATALYRDARRQSFGGISARPNIQNLPPNPKLPTADEFGAQRTMIEQEPASSSKKKSRFGFSSLLGKRPSSGVPNGNGYPEMHEVSGSIGQQQYLAPTNGRSGSDGPDDYTATGHATSTSRHSAMSSGGVNVNMPRNSIVGRKPLEELVSQDPEFVAYRYPSQDQRLDLLR